MEQKLVGQPEQLRYVKSGSCILFLFGLNSHICFVVQDDEQNKFVLDPNATTQQGADGPGLYPINQHLQDLPCLYYPQARLRPSMLPGNIGRGYYMQGGISRALYIPGDACVLRARLNTIQYPAFDIITGKIWQGQTSETFYTTRWAVEVPGDGQNFTELAAFTA